MRKHKPRLAGLLTTRPLLEGIAAVGRGGETVIGDVADPVGQDRVFEECAGGWAVGDEAWGRLVEDAQGDCEADDAPEGGDGEVDFCGEGFEGDWGGERDGGGDVVAC